MDDEPWEDYCPGLQASVKRLRLKKLRGASSDDDDGATVIKDDGQSVSFYAYLNTEFAYMTGKAAKNEINIRQLDPSDRALLTFPCRRSGLYGSVFKLSKSCLKMRSITCHQRPKSSVRGGPILTKIANQG